MVEAPSPLTVCPLPEHARLAQSLLDWFAVHQRPLPWRGHYEPYAVWISEIMLQQTQMERAVEYYNRWMALFPDVGSLAAASPEAVLKAWEGLGYYSRARNALAAAREIVMKYDGRFPCRENLLSKLPGVGEYTAGAVASIAFNRPVIAVDANVERVFARLFDLDAPVKSPAVADYIRHMARALMPEGRARDFNQALMELGALVCRKKPRCPECPLRAFCRAFALGRTGERPVPGKKTGYADLDVVAGVLLHRGRVFVQKRPASGLWANFWEFPGGGLEEGEEPAQGVCREFFEETELRVRTHAFLGVLRHSYTRYRIRLHCFLCGLEHPEEAPAPVLHAATECCWALPGDLEELPFPAGHRKLLAAWLPEIRKAAGES